MREGKRLLRAAFIQRFKNRLATPGYVVAHAFVWDPQWDSTSRLKWLFWPIRELDYIA